MKQNFIVTLVCLFISASAFSQGWVGDNTGNILVGRNAQLNLAPLNVGIGTAAPTANLHIAGDGSLLTPQLALRINQGGPGIANGIFMSEPASNNSARMYMTGNIFTIGRQNNAVAGAANAININGRGDVGIRTTAPTANLEITGDATAQTSRLALRINQGVPGIGNGIYIEEPGSTNSARIYMAANNIFKIGRQGNAPATDAITIDGTGQVGIRLLNMANPTANFHTDGTVRFENLPIGVGNNLVVDANGNVAVSACTCPSSGPGDGKGKDLEVQELKDKVSKMEKQIEEFNSLLNELKARQTNTDQSASPSQKLGEFKQDIKVYPNPSGDLFTIDLADLELSSLKYSVTDAMGQQVLKSTKEITSTKTQLDLSNFAKGVYYLTLYKEDQVVTTKKLMLSK